jgi:hypothetical protein
MLNHWTYGAGAIRHRGDYFFEDFVSVMAGLVPAIHVLLTAALKDVDTRDKPGHDEL